MREILMKILWHCLNHMGKITKEPFTKEELKSKGGLIDLYDEWLKESLRLLVQEGYLDFDGYRYRSKSRPLCPEEELKEYWYLEKKKWNSDENLKAQAELLECTIWNLEKVLTGKNLPAQYLFPNSSVELVGNVYKNNAAASYFNNRLADCVLEYIKTHLREDSDKKIRIFEIGAGTGATTKSVLGKIKVIKKNIEEYCYTDVSKAFLNHAEEHYGKDNSFLTYKIFNVEDRENMELSDVGNYDIVIAANVLHTTMNMRETLKNTKLLLKKNGLLILNEITKNSLMNHFTFGLLEGWWKYQDKEIRMEGFPGLHPLKWKEVLELEGFYPVLFPAKEASDLGQQIIMAESDGLLHLGNVNEEVKQSVSGVQKEAGIHQRVKKQKESRENTSDSMDTRDLSNQFKNNKEKVNRDKKVKKVILSELAQLLRIDENKITEKSSFSNYGLDSILAVNLTRKLNELLGIDLEITTLFEYNTLEELTKYVDSNYYEDITEAMENDSYENINEAVENSHYENITEAMENDSYENINEAMENDSYENINEAMENDSYENINEAAENSHYENINEAVENNVEEETEGLEKDLVYNQQKQTEENSKPVTKSIDEIAVVGLDGTFPMADNVKEFWENMISGKNCITKIPMEREDWKEFDTEEMHQFYDLDHKWGGFIGDVYGFDPYFFGIAPKEAESMSPEERLLLMSVWKTIEDAAITPEEMSEVSTGVFIAVGYSDYQLRKIYPKMLNNENGIMIQAISSIPNRISYLLNLKGPSEYCESTCSSSLVAIHRAMQAIKAGECSQALVGGVNLILSPGAYIGLEKMELLSPTGKARSFQNTADGFVIGEGVGSVLIKPLSKALMDNDNIYAIVKGSAVMHGGRGLTFYTPNIIGMKEAIAKVYQMADIGTETVSYIETHGVASQMSDNIELSALKTGYQENRKEDKSKNKCYIGSIKPCVGHLEVSAGIAAFIKVILSMKYKMIPKLADFGEMTGEVSLENSFLDIPRENMKWAELYDDFGTRLPKRAAVHGFGISGVNAHLLLEEYISMPVRKSNSFPITEEIIIISAKTEQQLFLKLEQMLEFLNEQREYSLQEIAFTLQTGRSTMEKKTAFVCKSIEDLKEKIMDYLITYQSKGNLEKLENCYTNIQNEKEPGFLNSVTKDILKKYFKYNKLNQIAFLWANGLNIDWKNYYNRSERKAKLPAYPFSHEKYFLSDMKKEGKRKSNKLIYPKMTKSDTDEIIGTQTGKKQDDTSFLVEEICQTLGLNKREIDYNESLRRYGLNSILGVELLRRLQKRYPNCTLKQILQLTSVKDYIRFFTIKEKEKDVMVENLQPDYKELIKLNETSAGTPVFWIHAASGGVETFACVAEKVNRPFYGIQARGYMTQEKPIIGIENIAKYYIEIIRSVQPKGPYDIGGYCLGGVISYEIVKQLQKRGEQVNSITMVDSPEPSIFHQACRHLDQNTKSIDLQFANMLLWPKQLNNDEIQTITKRLIRGNEINSNMEEREFCESLSDLIKQRGIQISREKLVALLLQNKKMQDGFCFDQYKVEKLGDNKSVTCFYFRNSSMLFYGELEPYMKMEDDAFSLDYINYFSKWKEQFERFSIIDVNDTNHMMMLTDERSRNKISEKCMEIYRH